MACDSGDEFRNQGKIEEASARYSRALALDPQSLRARLGLSAALARSGDPAGAHRQAEEALISGSLLLRVLKFFDPATEGRVGFPPGFPEKAGTTWSLAMVALCFGTGHTEWFGLLLLFPGILLIHFKDLRRPMAAAVYLHRPEVLVYLPDTWRKDGIAYVVPVLAGLFWQVVEFAVTPGWVLAPSLLGFHGPFVVIQAVRNLRGGKSAKILNTVLVAIFAHMLVWARREENHVDEMGLLLLALAPLGPWLGLKLVGRM